MKNQISRTGIKRKEIKRILHKMVKGILAKEPSAGIYIDENIKYIKWAIEQIEKIYKKIPEGIE